MGLMDLNLGRQPSDMMELRTAALPGKQLAQILSHVHPKIARFVRGFAKKPKAVTGYWHYGEARIGFSTYNGARGAFDGFVNRNSGKVKASTNSAKYYFPDRSVMTVKFKSHIHGKLRKHDMPVPGVYVTYNRKPPLTKPRKKPEPPLDEHPLDTPGW